MNVSEVSVNTNRIRLTILRLTLLFLWHLIPLPGKTPRSPAILQLKILLFLLKLRTGIPRITIQTLFGRRLSLWQCLL